MRGHEGFATIWMTEKRHVDVRTKDVAGIAQRGVVGGNSSVKSLRDLQMVVNAKPARHGGHKRADKLLPLTSSAARSSPLESY
uniref:Uncharacterized protein n=1 Tax=Peronospora matthiolae TaxID=2874970 RepID=A0AAV1VP85_9STRA